MKSLHDMYKVILIFCFLLLDYTPFNIFKRHMGEMLEVISDTERLANDLSLADFITDFVKDQVITTVLSRYEKASKLLNEVQRSLKVFNKPEMLTLYCEVLEKQKNPALKMIAQDMLKELGQLVIECFDVACSMIGGIFRMCSVIWDSMITIIIYYYYYYYYY